MELKRCCSCKETKSLSEFKRSKGTKDGYRHYCKECRRLHSAKYYVNHKDTILAAVRLYAANHPEARRIHAKRFRAKHREEIAEYQRARRTTVKAKARTLLGSAVARGDIIKPSRCSSCGRYVKKRSLHGHHDDYSKPLDVEWLCVKCHSRVRLAPTSNA